MAFCNSCGTSLANNAQFCPKCGAAQAGNTATSAPPPAAGGTAAHASNGLKIVLMVVAGIVVLGVLVVGMLTVVGLHIARHTHVTQNGDNVQIQGPFGTIDTNPSDVSRELGVDIYPGARMLKSNGANVQIAGVHTVAADFESDDPIDKVANFYKAKFPNATVSTASADHYTIVSTDKTVTTINIERQDGKTIIHLASVGGKAAKSDSSD